RSEQLRTRAAWANLAWALAAIPLQLIVASVVKPSTLTDSAELCYTVLTVAFFLSLYRIFSRGLTGAAEDFPLVTRFADPVRTRLERKRDSFLLWAQHMGRVLVVTIVALLAVAATGRLLGRAPAGRGWMWVNVIVLAIQTVLFFLFVRRLNEQAANAV